MFCYSLIVFIRLHFNLPELLPLVANLEYMKKKETIITRYDMKRILIFLICCIFLIPCNANNIVHFSKNDSIEDIQSNNTTSELTSEIKMGEVKDRNDTSNESQKVFKDYIKSKWIELLGLIIAFLTVFIPLYKYFSQKREEQKDKRFITYHQLIADLVTPPDGKLDRQIATVFELRNFPNYYELTRRIMTDLTDQWKEDPRNKRLIKELSLTLKYIEKRLKWYYRLIYKIFSIVK